MMTKEELISEYSLFQFGSSGIGALVSPSMSETAYEWISGLDSHSISKVQLNQLLVLAKTGSMSDGFFRYYWLSSPTHPYDVKRLPHFDPAVLEGRLQGVVSHDHLKWGLYRLYVDGLLYFGNAAAAYSALRSKSFNDLAAFFQEKRFGTDAIAARGPAIPLKEIAKDDRYLISEMVCKTFGDIPEEKEAARELLLGELRKQKKGSIVTFRQLLGGVSGGNTQAQFLLSFDEVLETPLSTESDLNARFEEQFDRFYSARAMATQNTALYLSMVNDLDVYVATSMRTRQNFRDMANACERIFHDNRLDPFHLRYFDPTMSAAKGHEDKGLIECLMVKCAKVLIYSEGEKESYGKDAEAAMALSLGKPVIFYCDHGTRTSFYRDVHPLSRLIDFRSGVAVGAIVTESVDDVAELLRRIFANEMEYEIRHHESRPGYLKLHEKLTGSVVRLQTDDDLLTTSFWNNYHNRERSSYLTLAAGMEAERLQE
jgi:hypothetical protein